MKRLPLTLTLTLCIAACATAYQPKGLTGGFNETQLSDDSYRVSFTGNGFTDADRATDFFLLRCAELALENGYPYFEISEMQDQSTTGTIHTPATTTTTGTLTGYGNTAYVNAQSTTTGGYSTQFTRPGVASLVRFLRQRSGAKSFEAAPLRDRIRAKYKMTE